MSIKITIPLPPVTKKNSQRIMHSSKTGKSFIMPSQKYIDYEAKAVWYCKKAGVHEPIDYPVEVKCLFYMPTRRRVDLTNPAGGCGRCAGQGAGAAGRPLRHYCQP